MICVAGLRRKLAILAGLTLCAMPTACDNFGSSDPMSAGAARPMSLAETYDFLRDAHAHARYGAIRPCLEPAQRNETVDLLITVGEFLAANEATLSAVRKSCPQMPTRQIDFSSIGDNLGLFSQHVERITVAEQGDRGIVTVQVAGQLPLVDLVFRRTGGVWRYVPGRGNPEVLQIIRQMREALDQIRRVALAGPHTPREIEREYKLRLGRRLRRMAQIAEADAQAVVAADLATHPASATVATP